MKNEEIESVQSRDNYLRISIFKIDNSTNKIQQSKQIDPMDCLAKNSIYLKWRIRNIWTNNIMIIVYCTVRIVAHLWFIKSLSATFFIAFVSFVISNDPIKI